MSLRSSPGLNIPSCREFYLWRLQGGWSHLATFLSRYNEEKDDFWTALVGDRIEGSITIDGVHAAVEGAHLRWFVISDGLRGKGAGNHLMSTAMDFCRSRGYGRVYLWTFEGLNPARHLYEKHGSRPVE